MIAVPAVDLRGGRCVQLESGDPSKERVALPDPVSVALGWVEKGFTTLHVVDLDAALGHGDNGDLVRELAALTGVTIQVGGGVRTATRVDQLTGDGAARVIVGTRALQDADLGWLRSLAGERPGQVVLAADVRGERVLTRGWTEESPWTLDTLFEQIGDCPLAGILVTDVGREGRLVGIDHEWTAGVVARSPVPVWMSGGIESIHDVRAGAEAGAAAAIIGMALYTGRIDATRLAMEFGGTST